MNDVQQIHLKFVVSTVAIIIGLASALYIGKLLEADAQNKLKNKSLKYVERWNENQAYRTKVIAFLREVDRIPVEYDERVSYIKKKFDDDIYLKQACLYYLNFFEEVAVALKQGVAHEETLHLFFRGIIIKYVEGLSCWVLARRSENSGKNANIFRNLTELCEAWK